VTAQLYGGISLDLLDGPIRTEYSTGVDGKRTARLVLGQGTQSIAVSCTRTTPAMLDELAEAVAELKAWVQRQQELNALPEVA
jgi:hypothetical protein